MRARPLVLRCRPVVEIRVPLRIRDPHAHSARLHAPGFAAPRSVVPRLPPPFSRRHSALCWRRRADERRADRDRRKVCVCRPTPRSPAIGAAPRHAARSLPSSARNPGFFGVQPCHTVIEITPGGGWYAEILAPYLRARGQYVAAVWDDAIPGQPKYRYDLNNSLRAKFAGNAAVYGKPDVRVFDPKTPVFGPAGSADAVLTFRNAHNWVSDDNAAEYFKAFFAVLSRAARSAWSITRAKPATIWDHEERAISRGAGDFASRRRGFKLDAKSEVNANRKNGTDHPNGVGRCRRPIATTPKKMPSTRRSARATG